MLGQDVRLAGSGGLSEYLANVQEDNPLSRWSYPEEMSASI